MMVDVHHVQLIKNLNLLLLLKANVEEYAKKLYAHRVQSFCKKVNVIHVQGGPNHWPIIESVDLKFADREKDLQILVVAYNANLSPEQMDQQHNNRTSTPNVCLIHVKKTKF